MERLVEEELNALVGEGAFGKNCNLVSFNLYNCMTGVDELWYQRIFCSVITSDGSNYNIMIKLKIQDLVLRGCFGCDILFNNELIFYNKVMPFLLECREPKFNDSNTLFLPRFFYGRNNCGELMTNDLIVIENINTLGYCLSDEKVFLDNDHLIIALQTLAKFHGLSYNAKHKDPGKVYGILENVHKTQFDANGHWMAQGDLFKKCGKRGMDRLLKRDGNRYRDHAHIRRLNELFDDAENALMRSLDVRGPLSVICHGDWHRETLFFQYDEHKRPFDATAIDFSTLHYGSPALDLSSFLYISTTQRVREAQWDNLLDTYCAALAASVPPGVRVPCRAEIDVEIAETAINSLAKVSFALPFMLRDRSDTLDSLATSDDPVDYFLALGGDMATECLADIVMHLADMGYTDVGRDKNSDLVENTDSKYVDTAYGDKVRKHNTITKTTRTTLIG